MTSAGTDARLVLAPGQRYVQPGAPTWRVDLQFTVARLDRDALGLPRVTFRSPDGQEFTVYTEQIEAALAEGQIVPVGTMGPQHHC